MKTYKHKHLWYLCVFLLGLSCFQLNAQDEKPVEEELEMEKGDEDTTSRVKKKNNEGYLRFGLSFTPTFNWFAVENSDIEKEGSPLTLGYGLMIDYYFKKHSRFILSSGIYLSPHKAAYNAPSPEGLTETRMRYLEIPIALKFVFNEYGYFTPFGQIGLVPGLSVRGRYDQIGNDIRDEKAKSITQPFDAALRFGGGTEFGLGPDLSAYAGLFYHNGLLNVITDDDGKSIRNRRLMLRLGLFF